MRVAHPPAAVSATARRNTVARKLSRGFAVLALTALVPAAAGAAGAAGPVPAVERSTGLGRISGFVDGNGSLAWLGIPYARPPIGPLRWRAPQPASPWRDVRAAQRAAAPCIQPARTGSALIGEEDCLYLNIHAPANALPDDRRGLPVMVWIHGGANLRGDGASYDGGVLASRQKVIVVTINYRLGLFGWFSHPALRKTADNPLDRSGNFGTLDQIMALRWVREHIAGFGGDPDRVTVFGESAGGSNVLALLTAPGAAGLFQRAIVQSGSVRTVSLAEAMNPADAPVPGMPLSSARILRQLVLGRHAESNGDRPLGRRQVSAWLEARTPLAVSRFLRARSPAELQAAIDRLVEAADGTAAVALPTLFRDGAVLPEMGIRGALAEGRYHRVPVMIGSTRDEFTVLLPMFAGQTSLVRTNPDGIGFLVPDRKRYHLTAEYLSRLMKASSVDGPARWLASGGTRGVFVYRFDWDELAPAPWLDGVRLGATHGLDVPFVFGHRRLGAEYVQLPLIRPKSDASFRMLSSAMMSYWAEFAATGDPGRGRNRRWPHWEAWGTGTGPAERFIVLDTPHRNGLRMSGETLTTRGILKSLKTDPRLNGNSERLELIRQLELFGRMLGLELR